jgi:Fe-S cluster assembly protein SufD
MTTTEIDVEVEPHKAHYLADLAKLPENGRAPWLDRMHAAGVARFQQTPLPTTKMEEWRETNISELIKTEFRSLVEPREHGLTKEQVAPYFYGEGAWTELVFVNGFYAPELSVTPGLPEGVFAGSLADGLAGDGMAVVEQHLGQYLADRNAFTALNSAFIQDGALLHVAKNVAVEQPIHFVFICTEQAEKSAAHLRNLYVLESGSQTSVVTSYIGLAGKAVYLNNVVEEWALAPNSHVHLYKLVEEGPAGNHLATSEFHQDRDSALNTFVMSMSGKVVRNQLCVKLDGENGSADLRGLYLNDGDRLIDNPLSITHVKPHCFSRIMYKGILDGKSHAAFAGKVYVHREAQQTDSNQLSQNLMLSDDATIHTRPQLEIYADDVKCTHGATIGAPPEPVVFYFRSRGIDPATAMAMLTYGFAEEVVSEIAVPELSERLGQYVYKKYSP